MMAKKLRRGGRQGPQTSKRRAVRGEFCRQNGQKACFKAGLSDSVNCCTTFDAKQNRAAQKTGKVSTKGRMKFCILVAKTRQYNYCMQMMESEKWGTKTSFVKTTPLQYHHCPPPPFCLHQRPPAVEGMNSPDKPVLKGGVVKCIHIVSSPSESGG